MKIIVRPMVDPQREIDLTRPLVAAIAEELWRLYGGNEHLNWLEAELHLQSIIGEARAAAQDTSIITVGSAVDADSAEEPVVPVRPVGMAMHRPIRRSERPDRGERAPRRADRPVACGV